MGACGWVGRVATGIAALSIAAACSPPCLDDGLVQHDNGNCDALPGASSSSEGADDSGDPEDSTSDATLTADSSEGTTEGTSDGTTGSTSAGTTESTSAGTTESTSDGTTDGTTSEGTTDGTTSEGTTDGTTSDGTTESTSDVTTSDGTTSEGTTSDGTTSDGTTSDGTTSDGTTGESSSDDGSSSGTIVTTTWCLDADLDGFGTPDDCVDVPDGDPPPPGFVEDATDCDDLDAATFPGAAQIEDALACMRDGDDDGWGSDTPSPGVTPGTDCDDADPTVVLGCTSCIPTDLACLPNGDLGQCNANGTFYQPIQHCDFGCDAAAAACLSALTVDIPAMCRAVQPGDSIVLDATVSGGDGNYSFAWTPLATLDDATIEDPSATPLAITQYDVTVTDGAGNVGAASAVVHVAGAPWDLAQCELFTFDSPFDDDTQPAYALTPDGAEACNTVTSVPSALVCPWVVEAVHLEGRMIVDSTDEDGGIGFLWGFQDENHFYVLSWKQADEPSNFGVWPAGLTVKRVQADAGGVVAADMLQPTDSANSVTHVGPGDFGDGWEDQEEYVITLDHAFPFTAIEIRHADDDTLVVGGTIADLTYASGRFGIFDATQIQACSGPWTSDCL